MSNELNHHGIDGQKWGERRFQNPDGSLTPLGRLRYGVGKKQKNTGSDSAQKNGENKPPRKSNKAVKNDKRMSNARQQGLSEMSDDELRSRISRLKMETEYSELVKRINANAGNTNGNDKSIKQLLKNATHKFAEQSIDKLVSNAVNRIFDKKDDFDINKYKDMDVYKMDSDTIKKVADWYTKASTVDKQRKALNRNKDKKD